MKILTWNCNQGISDDFSAIKDFDADVVIIQECEKLDKNSFESYSSHWIGNNNRKGLAVLTKEKSALPTEVFNESLIYFLPVSFKDTAVLGVWAFNRRARKKVEGSSGFPIDAINHYKDWLSFLRVCTSGALSTKEANSLISIIEESLVKGEI